MGSAKASSPNVLDATVSTVEMPSAMDEKGDMASVAGEAGSGRGSDCGGVSRGEMGDRASTYIVDCIKVEVI